VCLADVVAFELVRVLVFASAIALVGVLVLVIALTSVTAICVSTRHCCCASDCVLVLGRVRLLVSVLCTCGCDGTCT